MIVIGRAKYNNHHRVDLLWDNETKGIQAIKARTFNQQGYFPVTENYFETLKEAIDDIPDEFSDWNIFDEFR